MADIVDSANHFPKISMGKLRDCGEQQQHRQKKLCHSGSFFL
jgi:hypothetical protein